MRDLVLRAIRIFGPAILVAGLPVLASDYVLRLHALSTGRSETVAIADRFVERAETVIGEGLAVLRETRAAGHTGCALADRQAYGAEAFKARHIQQVGLADAEGTLLCGEPMGPLTEPIRLPRAEPGDPSVMIGILTDGRDDRQAMVTLRAGDDRRLVARIDRGAMEIAAGPKSLQPGLHVAVQFEDGSTWFVENAGWRADPDVEEITETIVSRRFPIKVTVSTSAAAALATVEPLRVIVLVLSTFGGIVAFALSLISVWRQESGDTFTRAIRNREFVPFYQPMVDLKSGAVIGCEVLVRWHRADGAMVPPSQFLPYAEATGLIRDITRQLMEQTVADVAELYAERPELKLSINLTAMHFNDLEIIDDVRRIYRDSGIRFEQLCFEVTEQHPLKDLHLSRTIIGRIQGLGASVALDDVGTGHGGLAYLQKLGVDTIKIDKMFIDDLGVDHSAETIVDTLIELGSQLGLGIVAEGVERQDQADHLRAKGVTAAQGYFFAQPLTAAAYVEFLRRQPQDGPVSTPIEAADETRRRSAA